MTTQSATDEATVAFRDAQQRVLDLEPPLLDGVRRHHHHLLDRQRLFEEIERAELHDAQSLPGNVVTLGSEIDFLDERTSQMRTVKLVLPAEANSGLGRISILTPMGNFSLRTAAGR